MEGKMKKLALIGAVVLAGALSAPASANPDSGLYDPLPPEGSAFVRFINSTPSKGSEEVKAQGKTYDYLDYKEASAYYAMPGGSIDAQVGGVKKTFDAAAGGFYTLVLDDGELRVFEDEQNNNRAKAQITLYNLGGDNGLNLKTADGKVEVIPGTATDQTGVRQINPVKVPLALFKDEQKLKDLGPVSLERSQAYSVILFPTKEAALVKSTTNTTR
jgi:hypothetical protein